MPLRCRDRLSSNGRCRPDAMPHLDGSAGSGDSEYEGSLGTTGELTLELATLPFDRAVQQIASVEVEPRFRREHLDRIAARGICEKTSWKQDSRRCRVYTTAEFVVFSCSNLVVGHGVAISKPPGLAEIEGGASHWCDSAGRG